MYTQKSIHKRGYLKIRQYILKLRIMPHRMTTLTATQLISLNYASQMKNTQKGVQNTS